MNPYNCTSTAFSTLVNLIGYCNLGGNGTT